MSTIEMCPTPPEKDIAVLHEFILRNRRFDSKLACAMLGTTNGYSLTLTTSIAFRTAAAQPDDAYTSNTKRSGNYTVKLLSDDETVKMIERYTVLRRNGCSFHLLSELSRDRAVISFVENQYNLTKASCICADLSISVKDMRTYCNKHSTMRDHCRRAEQFYREFSAQLVQKVIASKECIDLVHERNILHVEKQFMLRHVMNLWNFRCDQNDTARRVAEHKACFAFELEFPAFNKASAVHQSVMKIRSARGTDGEIVFDKHGCMTRTMYPCGYLADYVTELVKSHSEQWEEYQDNLEEINQRSYYSSTATGSPPRCVNVTFRENAKMPSNTVETATVRPTDSPQPSTSSQMDSGVPTTSLNAAPSACTYPVEPPAMERNYAVVQMARTIEGHDDDTVCECIRMDTSALQPELGLMDTVFDPANEVLCTKFAIIELVAATGRTIERAAYVCGIPVQEAHDMVDAAKRDGRFFLCRQRVSNEVYANEVGKGRGDVSPMKIKHLLIRVAVGGNSPFVCVSMSDSSRELLKWRSNTREYMMAVHNIQCRRKFESPVPEPNLKSLVDDDELFERVSSDEVDAVVTTCVIDHLGYDVAELRDWVSVYHDISDEQAYQWHLATNTIINHARRAYRSTLIYMTSELQLNSSVVLENLEEDARNAIITYLISGNEEFCTEADTMKRVLALVYSMSTDDIEDIPRRLHESYPEFRCSINNDVMKQHFKQYPYPFLVRGWLNPISRKEMFSMLGALGETDTEQIQNNSNLFGTMSLNLKRVSTPEQSTSLEIIANAAEAMELDSNNNPPNGK